MVGVGNLLREKKDYAAAMAQWELALSTAASPEAAYNLGVCYGLGCGVPTDLAQAACYYEHAASIELSYRASGSSDMEVVHALTLNSGYSKETQEEYQALARKNLQVVRRDLSIAQSKSPAPRPPSPPAALPKPKSVRRPKGLAELYPGPPPWLDSPETVLGDLAAKGLPPMMMKMMLGAYMQQRQSDERWRHLTHLYRGQEKTRLSLEEHAGKFTEAGYDFSEVLRKRPRPRACAWHEAHDLLHASGLRMLEGYVPPSPPLPRFCDYCGRQCTAECRCGESYCDKDCQAMDWPNHREICETVADNAEMAMTLTKQSWGPKGAIR